MWTKFVTISLIAFCTSAQERFPSLLPDNLRVPADQVLILQAHGMGDQIYMCATADGKYGWTLKAPDARLLGSDGQVVGHHFAGPTWQASDGSKVVGKAVANAPSPSSNAVPWLLVVAVRHEGEGTMNRVLSIQRLNTKGGKAPVNGCDGSHSGAEVRIPYEADYYFYGQSK